MSNGERHTPKQEVKMNEDTKRTLVMAAAAIVGRTMSVMHTNEWKDQLPNVMSETFKHLLDEYKKLP